MPTSCNPYIQFCASYRASSEWKKMGAHLSVPEQGKLLGQMYRSRVKSSPKSAVTRKKVPNVDHIRILMSEASNLEDKVTEKTIALDNAGHTYREPELLDFIRASSRRVCKKDVDKLQKNPSSSILVYDTKRFEALLWNWAYLKEMDYQAGDDLPYDGADWGPQGYLWTPKTTKEVKRFIREATEFVSDA